jgi:uncharacterized protein Veg
MTRGRKPLSQTGITKIYSFKVTEELHHRLQSIPNVSQLIRRAIERELNFFDETQTINQIANIDQEIAQHEGQILKLKNQKTQDEDRLRRKTLSHQKKIEARVRLLELVKNSPRTNFESWLATRGDILTDCGFYDISEALIFIEKERRK